MNDVEPSLAGPRRPQDRVALANAANEFATALMDTFNKGDDANRRVKIAGTREVHRPWRCGDRGDHLLHQHLEPLA